MLAVVCYLFIGLEGRGCMNAMQSTGGKLGHFVALRSSEMLIGNEAKAVAHEPV